MDAANILKPALARGELRAIGATTLAEYQKYDQTYDDSTRYDKYGRELIAHTAFIIVIVIIIRIFVLFFLISAALEFFLLHPVTGGVSGSSDRSPGIGR